MFTRIPENFHRQNMATRAILCLRAAEACRRDALQISADAYRDLLLGGYDGDFDSPFAPGEDFRDSIRAAEEDAREALMFTCIAAYWKARALGDDDTAAWAIGEARQQAHGVLTGDGAKAAGGAGR